MTRVANGKQGKNVNEIINKTVQVFYAMERKFVSKREIKKRTKLKVFSTIFADQYLHVDENHGYCQEY